jgi:hypothetical protein
MDYISEAAENKRRPPRAELLYSRLYRSYGIDEYRLETCYKYKRAFKIAVKQITGRCQANG